MKELKPCPFCGSKRVKVVKPQIAYEGWKYTVVCVNCETGIIRSGYSAGLYDDDKEAVQAWNRRYNPDEDDGR